MRTIRLLPAVALLIAACAVTEGEVTSPPTTTPVALEETTAPEGVEAPTSPTTTQQPSPSAPPDTPVSTVPASGDAGAGGGGTASAGEVPTAVLERLLAEAAVRLGVPVEDVDVERASPWAWPDTAFGCPRKDLAYAQVITEGYWVILSAHDAQLDFRVDRDGDWLLCERQPLPESGDIQP